MLRCALRSFRWQPAVRGVANNHVAVSSARVNSSRFITSATVPRRNDEENSVQDEDPYLGTKIEIQLMEGQPDPEIKDQNEYPDWLWGLLEDRFLAGPWAKVRCWGRTDNERDTTNSKASQPR